jgi:hypothetical protein
MSECYPAEEHNRETSATCVASPPLSDLLPCPVCGADPKTNCIIKVDRGREPHDQNVAYAKCTMCSYVVTVSTAKSPVVVRDLWNVRAR